VHGLPQRTALDIRGSQHGREFFRLPLCRYRIDENRGQPAIVLGVSARGGRTENSDSVQAPETLLDQIIGRFFAVKAEDLE